MVIDHVKWDYVQNLIENSLERAELSRRDLEESFDIIRFIIRDDLEIYIDKKYIDQFCITMKSFGRVIYINLSYDLKTLCEWKVSCQA